MNISKLKHAYSTAAVLMFNTFLFLVLINILIGLGFYIRDTAQQIKGLAASKHMAKTQRFFDKTGKPLDNGQRSEYQMDWFDYTAYENFVDERYAAAVLDDFFKLAKQGFIYQPWVQFSEPPFNGKLLHIDLDEKGFPIRRTANPQKNSGPVLRVFCFGGSTTFGYNVSDEHTWPSYLSGILNKIAEEAGLGVQIEVTNYGRGMYTPAQELALLTTLIKAGHRPDLAIFMDGANWGSKKDAPYFTDKLKNTFLNSQFESYDRMSVLNRLNWIPMVRLANALKYAFIKRMSASQPKTETVETDPPGDYVEIIAQRFEITHRLMEQTCRSVNIQSLFFLQPDSLYTYNKNLFRRSPLPDDHLRRIEFRKRFYGQLKPAGYMDLTGLFAEWGADRKAIIDNVHYSPLFNRFLAEHIARHTIDLKSFVK